jgi:hypothetical protein
MKTTLAVLAPWHGMAFGQKEFTPVFPDRSLGFEQ